VGTIADRRLKASDSKRKSEDAEVDDDTTSVGAQNKHIFIFNRPWYMGHHCNYSSIGTSSYLSPYKKTTNRIQKRTLKNMDIVEGLLTKNRLKKWGSSHFLNV
jgi:hypothetical protein